MHASPKITPPPLKNHKMVDEQRMKAALDALDRQLIPNYAAILKEFELERTTLMRRDTGPVRSIVWQLNSSTAVLNELVVYM